MTLHPQSCRAKIHAAEATLSIPPERRYLFTASTAARIRALLDRDDCEAHQREPRS